MTPALPSRRHILKSASALGLVAVASAVHAAPPSATPALTVLAMADIHSAYERMAQALAHIETRIRALSHPAVIVINGDLFELGNRVAVRSKGVIDWAFLAALPALAPTIFNLGNHDNDLIPDLAEVVERIEALGIHVVTTITNPRTGRTYAPTTLDLEVGQRRLRVVGMGCNALNTYPAESRQWLDVPAADDWAKTHLATALEGSDLRLVLAHAGVAQEREILPYLPAHSLLIGGHNHLSFTDERRELSFGHSGSWANHVLEAHYHADDQIRLGRTDIGMEMPRHPALASLITATLDQHLTNEDRAVLGQSPQALSLGDTGRKVAEGLAKAAGADIGFIGHTTLGTGLSAGPVSRFDFDAVVRFDGKLMVAEITPEQYATIAPRLNQDRPIPLAQRTGDFLYAAGDMDTAKPLIRIATNDWAALNQAEYFGLTGIDFTPVPEASIKAIARQTLLPA